MVGFLGDKATAWFPTRPPWFSCLYRTVGLAYTMLTAGWSGAQAAIENKQPSSWQQPEYHETSIQLNTQLNLHPNSQQNLSQVAVHRVAQGEGYITIVRQYDSSLTSDTAAARAAIDLAHHHAQRTSSQASLDDYVRFEGGTMRDGNYVGGKAVRGADGIPDGHLQPGDSIAVPLRTPIVAQGNRVDDATLRTMFAHNLANSNVHFPADGAAYAHDSSRPSPGSSTSLVTILVIAGVLSGAALSRKAVQTQRTDPGKKQAEGTPENTSTVAGYLAAGLSEPITDTQQTSAQQPYDEPDYEFLYEHIPAKKDLKTPLHEQDGVVQPVTRNSSASSSASLNRALALYYGCHEKAIHGKRASRYDHSVASVCSQSGISTRTLYRALQEHEMPTRRDCEGLIREHNLHYAKKTYHTANNSSTVIKTLQQELGLSPSTLRRYISSG